MLQQTHKKEPPISHKSMYKSCCVPNSSTDDISPPRDHIHFRPNNIDKTDYSICLEASSKKAKIVLVILFLICLGLYGYVIIDGDSASLKNDSQNQMAKDKTNSCFEDFRKHNCTIGKPMSEVCEQLYACVRKTTSEGKGEIDVSTKKIDRIE